MKSILLGLVCSILLFSACKKNETDDTPVAVAPQFMETGVYLGKYIEAGTGSDQVIYQFRMMVTQVDDTTYNVTQLDPGNLPSFNMIAALSTMTGSKTIIKFRIPHQNSGGAELVGDARINSGYDAYWDSSQKIFNFGIVFNNDPTAYIRLTSTKE